MRSIEILTDEIYLIFKILVEKYLKKKTQSSEDYLDGLNSPLRSANLIILTIHHHHDNYHYHYYCIVVIIMIITTKLSIII
jgi:hypothetical protein